MFSESQQKLINDLIQRSWQDAYQQSKHKGFRHAFPEGYEQGLRITLPGCIELLIELKFGAAGLALMPEIRQIQSLDILKTILDQIKTADSAEVLRRIYLSGLKQETAGSR
jgi:hypothetical protein